MSPSRRTFVKSALAVSAAMQFPMLLQAQQARVWTVAGTGIAGYQYEGATGALATDTPINNPYGVVTGPDGALYFCEVDSGRTRRLDLGSRRLSTVAGNGEKAYAGDGGPALSAAFSAPHEIRFDTAGHLYVVERDAHVVRRVAADTGVVGTLAGTGEAGFSGDGGPASSALLRQPHSIAFTADGQLLICDIGNQRVRQIDMRSLQINTLSGNGTRDSTPDEAELSGVPLAGPRSLDTDLDGNAYLVLREGNAVFKMDLQAARLQRIAGTGERGFSGDGGQAIHATFNGPKGIAYSSRDHSLYIVDTENHTIRRLQLDTGIITTVLGTGQQGHGADGDPLQCELARPHGVCVHEGIVYVTDSENHRVRAVEGLM